MSREVFFVLAAWGGAHGAALSTLRRWLARHFPRSGHIGVVVDNALPGCVEEELDSATTALSGDNRWHEFSGWDRGLAWLDAAYRVRSDSPMVLANDTIQRPEWREYLEGMEPARIVRALSLGGLAGRTDVYPREVKLFGLGLQRWLCSAFMVTTARTLDRLRPLALPFSDQEIFGSASGELFARPSPLCETYRSYLRSWLLDEPGELRSRWRSAAPLTSQNAATIRGKARAILCEHHLSARAAVLDVQIFDGR